MSRFSTTLDVSKELKGFEDDSGDEVEEEAEGSSSGKESKPKKSRNYAEEFETYDREEDKEEDMNDEMDELDSAFNGESKAKTMSENEPEKVVVESYNVKKKHKAEFVDVDEVAEPKDKDDEEDKENNDDSEEGNEGDDEGGEPKKVNGGKKDATDEHEGKTSWLWATILIILIIGAGAAGYFLLKNARQHAAETNLSEFPEQIAKDSELLGQNLNMSIAGELGNELEPAAGENETNGEITSLPIANESLAEPVVNESVINASAAEPEEPASAENETAAEDNESSLKDVLIQGLN